jgi:hypothetical protein
MTLGRNPLKLNRHQPNPDLAIAHSGPDVSGRVATLSVGDPLIWFHQPL